MNPQYWTGLRDPLDRSVSSKPLSISSSAPTVPFSWIFSDLVFNGNRRLNLNQDSAWILFLPFNQSIPLNNPFLQALASPLTRYPESGKYRFSININQRIPHEIFFLINISFTFNFNCFFRMSEVSNNTKNSCFLLRRPFKRWLFDHRERWSIDKWR